MSGHHIPYRYQYLDRLNDKLYDLLEHKISTDTNARDQRSQPNTAKQSSSYGLKSPSSFLGKGLAAETPKKEVSSQSLQIRKGYGRDIVGIEQ